MFCALNIHSFQGAEIDNYIASIRINDNPTAVSVSMTFSAPGIDDPNAFWSAYVSGKGDYRSLSIEGWKTAIYLDNGFVRSIFCWKSYGDDQLICCECNFFSEIKPETVAAMLEGI